MKRILLIIFFIPLISFADYKYENCGSLTNKVVGYENCQQKNGEFAVKKMVIYGNEFEEGFDFVDAYLYYQNGEMSCWEFNDNHNVCFDNIDNFPSANGPI